MTKYPDGHLYSRVPRISTPQDGVFSRAQARSAGFTRGAIDWRVERGLWVPVAGAGLIEQGEPVKLHQLVNAMALTWPDAVVIGPSAAQLWYMSAPLPDSSTLMCAVPQQRRQRPGLKPRLAQLPENEVTKWRRNILIQRRHPALMDSLAWLPRAAADELFAWIMLHRRISANEFANLLAPRAGHRGVVRLREYHEWLNSRAASFLEFQVHCLLRAAGIEGWKANEELILPGGKRVFPDILFEEKKVVIEVDSREYHHTWRAFNDDRTRDNRYHASGYQTLRVTAQIITQTPNQFLSDVRALLAMR